MSSTSMLAFTWTRNHRLRIPLGVLELSKISGGLILAGGTNLGGVTLVAVELGSAGSDSGFARIGVTLVSDVPSSLDQDR
jgi:hypothetical protein